MRPLRTTAILAAAVVAAAPPAAHAGAASTRLVSKTSGGDPANGTSADPSVSSSGRYVAFASDAANLPGDDSLFNIYVHDRQTGTTRLVSKTSGGDPANGNSGEPSISSSGRYVAFASGAANLPGNDSVTDVYVHDRQTGTTRLVSKTSGGDPADGSSFAASISSSGRYVAFTSAADNLPGNDSLFNIYVHDRETGNTRLVSKRSGGDPADGTSSSPSISSSGRHVAFASVADNLPGNDSVSDVYVHDRETGNTTLVSKRSGGDPADDNSFSASISSSGRYVAFASNADNLPGNDSFADVYLHDRKTGTTRLVSQTSGGDPGNGSSVNPSISSSGRYVAFASGAANLPGNDSVGDIYVHDRETGTTRLVSKTSGGDPADGSSVDPSISSLGRYVAFGSTAANLPGNDSVADVYLRGPLT